MAILLVVLWHYIPRIAPTPQWLIAATRLFWSGVDLFFVLSGFLIAGILLQNARAKNYFSTFYIRRAARIIPLYALLLFVLVVFVHYQPDFLKKIYRGHLPLWSYFTFTQNFLYAARGTFLDPWIDVTWSLAIEEQFYVVLSLLVLKLQRKDLAIVSLALIVLAPILRYSASQPTAALVLPLHRADSLMLGVLLALFWQWDQGKEFIARHAKYVRWLSVPLLIGVIFLTIWYVRPGNPLGHTWLALVYGDLLLVALLHRDNPTRPGILTNPVSNWLGLRSYGLYLLHKPVQILVPFTLVQFLDLHLSVSIQIIIYVLVVCVAAEISYRLIEKPVMDLGHRFKYEE